MPDRHPLYIALISVHGLIRGRDPELGRDPDTGGQVRYVLELARALAEHPEVERVELLTRQVVGASLDPQYSEPTEALSERARIVRIPCGPRRYLRKEVLWPHLPEFVDGALQHFRDVGRVPDVVHGHYADAGAVALSLTRLLDTLLVHTGHSLGRVKQQRLSEQGHDPEELERRYHFSRRIGAEEGVLAAADLVVASTHQEVEEQYALYQTPARSRMLVIPPGVSLERFRPPRATDRRPPVADAVERFLADPRRPMIVVVQRPDERKNLATLIRAYGESESLRRLANLVLLIGTRDDLTELQPAQRQELEEMLRLVDLYDLYGSVAYPKRHDPQDVSDLYRLAVRRHGVFVNPALTEPFGLTLIEAAASGLPVVATHDGGPQAIVRLCRNGVLVDPTDPAALATAIEQVLSDRRAYRQRSRAGIRGAHAHFSWPGHVERYLKAVRRLERRRDRRPVALPGPNRLLLARGLLLCDIDHTLLGDAESLRELLGWLEAHRSETVFGVATGRVLGSALKVLADWGVPMPDVLVTAVGSEIHYGGARPVEDASWRRAIDVRWQPHLLREVLEGVPGLRLQPRPDQRRFKLSYFVDPNRASSVAEVRRRLRQHDLSARAIFSHGTFLDLLPSRASKGGALRHLSNRWGISLERVLVAGDSGNDADMLTSGARAVVVGNHSPELLPLRGQAGVYFARAEHAAGVLEGIRHHSFPEGEDAGLLERKAG